MKVSTIRNLQNVGVLVGWQVHPEPADFKPFGIEG